MYTRNALLNTCYWRCYTKHVLLEMISTLEMIYYTCYTGDAILNMSSWRCCTEHVLLEMLCMLEMLCILEMVR